MPSTVITDRPRAVQLNMRALIATLPNGRDNPFHGHQAFPLHGLVPVAQHMSNPNIGTRPLVERRSREPLNSVLHIHCLSFSSEHDEARVRAPIFQSARAPGPFITAPVRIGRGESVAAGLPGRTARYGVRVVYARSQRMLRLRIPHRCNP